MLDAFKLHIDSIAGLKSGANINIACSGGVDSIVLVELMHQLNFSITVLHCNFKLREESDEDSKWLQRYCEERNIKCIVKEFDTHAILSKRKGAIQEVARDIRYEWFREMNEKDNSPLLVAHHQDDQIETFLQNLERGAGVLGLASMLVRNDFIYRPLLGFSKAEIIDFAINNSITWREDASNATIKYNRNVYRNALIPLLPAATKSMIISLINDFQQLQIVSEICVSKSLRGNCISITNYEALPRIFQQQLCREWKIPTSAVNEINKLCKAQVGAVKEFGSKTIWRERENLVLELQNDVQYKLLQEEVELSAVDFNTSGVFIDADKTVGSLTLRKYKQGEYFSPLGLNGKKLVSAYLKDLKIPSHQKKNTLVVADAEKIIWIPVGVPSNKVKISNVTKKVFWLKIEK